jgi:Xaa-Pro aminopeptidase
MTCKFIYANTKNSDMFYAVKTIIPDACFLLQINEQKFIFLDKRELGVFQDCNVNQNFKAVPVEPFIKKAEQLKSNVSLDCRLAFIIVQKYISHTAEIEVPAHFPLDIADFLRSRGIVLKVSTPFFLMRSIKEDLEILAIEQSLKKVTVAFRRIEEILKNSSIKNDRIMFEGAILTSEFIKQEVDVVLLRENMLNTEGIIISSGKQASMPHHAGSGPLLPNKPIICDIFPRDRTNGYFADMTRTYVKGKASLEMKKIYDAVLEAQSIVIDAIRPGITGSEIHKICCDSFRDNNYEVGDRGFLHNTGHGLGLDIHELPYLSGINHEPLVRGNVVTVEPGLYYEDGGSARVEDVIVVTKTGSRNLTNYPKILEIP